MSILLSSDINPHFFFFWKYHPSQNQHFVQLFSNISYLNSCYDSTLQKYCIHFPTNEKNKKYNQKRKNVLCKKGERGEIIYTVYVYMHFYAMCRVEYIFASTSSQASSAWKQQGSWTIFSLTREPGWWSDSQVEPGRSRFKSLLSHDISLMILGQSLLLSLT